MRWQRGIRITAANHDGFEALGYSAPPLHRATHALTPDASLSVAPATRLPSGPTARLLVVWSDDDLQPSSLIPCDPKDRSGNPSGVRRSMARPTVKASSAIPPTRTRLSLVTITVSGTSRVAPKPRGCQPALDPNPTFSSPVGVRAYM